MYSKGKKSVVSYRWCANLLPVLKIHHLWSVVKKQKDNINCTQIIGNEYHRNKSHKDVMGHVRVRVKTAKFFLSNSMTFFLVLSFLQSLRRGINAGRTFVTLFLNSFSLRHCCGLDQRFLVESGSGWQPDNTSLKRRETK